jgi:MerR family copper efflux transcriptional regulator
MDVTSSSPPGAALSSGELCRIAGVTRGTLRVYEREGLLGLPPRGANGYRRFPSDAVQRLQAIRQLKAVGFSLREIGWLLAERDDGGLSPAQMRQLAREQVTAIDQRIAQLQVVREMAAAVAAGHTELMDDPECGFLLRFLAAGQPVQAVAAEVEI